MTQKTMLVGLTLAGVVVAAGAACAAEGIRFPGMMVRLPTMSTPVFPPDCSADDIGTRRLAENLTVRRVPVILEAPMRLSLERLRHEISRYPDQTLSDRFVAVATERPPLFCLPQEPSQS